MPEKDINSDLIRGHIDTIILKILRGGDSYGYEIMKAVYTNSGGEYELKEPSLYTSLKRLEKLEHIVSYWGDESQGGAGSITTSPKAALPPMRRRWAGGSAPGKSSPCLLNDNPA